MLDSFLRLFTERISGERPFVIVHSQGMGDIIFYLAACASVNKLPAYAFVRQASAFQFVKFAYPSIKSVKYKNNFVYFCLSIINPHGTFISHPVSTSFARVLRITGTPPALFGSRKLMRTTQYIPRGHLANRALMHVSLMGHQLPEGSFVTTSPQKLDQLSMPAFPRTYYLHPGCGLSQSFKRWPVHYYVGLANAILEQDDSAHVRVTIGPDELELVDSFSSINCERFKILPLPSFESLKSIIDGNSIVISGDCGMAHLATFFNATLIVLIGPSNPIKTRPIGSNVFVVKSATHFGCSPCITKYSAVGCSSPACMNTIQLSQVMNAIQMLGSSSTPKCYD